MPINKPSKGEDKNTYISKCISEEVAKGHEQQQAIAMCISAWETLMKETRLSEILRIRNGEK